MNKRTLLPILHFTLENDKTFEIDIANVNKIELTFNNFHNDAPFSRTSTWSVEEDVVLRTHVLLQYYLTNNTVIIDSIGVVGDKLVIILRFVKEDTEGVITQLSDYAIVYHYSDGFKELNQSVLKDSLFANLHLGDAKSVAFKVVDVKAVKQFTLTGKLKTKQLIVYQLLSLLYLINDCLPKHSYTLVQYKIDKDVATLTLVSEEKGCKTLFRALSDLPYNFDMCL